MATPASLPVGFRFHPTEEELIDHFLKKKIKGQDFNEFIPEINICSCEPWDLPGFSPIRSDDDEWFYFSRPDYKTKGNSRNRATLKGFWKITGVEREIKARRSKALIGKKRTLTFYKGKVRSAQKTGWVIHEYYIPETLLPNAARQRDFVLCRLKKKDESTDSGTCDEGEVCQTSTNNASDFQNNVTSFGRPSIQEETRPEEIFAELFSSHESPPSPDYFASMLGENFLLANAGNDDHLDLESVYRHEDSDEGDYTLEDRPRTTLLNHSSEPTSTLHGVYDEGIHQQKNASSVNVAATLPQNIGRILSVKLEESKYEPKEVLQAGSSSDSLLSALVTYKSSLNESWHRKDEMVTAGGAELQSGRQLPFKPESKVYNPTAPTYQGQIKQGFRPQEVKYTSKGPETPRGWRNDEQKSMKQKQTETAVRDWKSSFIVWTESPLCLGSCPPVVYFWNLIIGLVLFKFFVGELISYGKW